MEEKSLVSSVSSKFNKTENGLYQWIKEMQLPPFERALFNLNRVKKSALLVIYYYPLLILFVSICETGPY